ncbi:UPF0146 family protein [Haloarchaeobius sp. HRN-SO-5]|uniref:UPF0146 family protein n=1 Tax=Haloarchaeobius sp. HRN-SO-5 TaxID=3446118 RepID=UPI003EBFF60B
MAVESTHALVDRLGEFDRLVEVGIGRRTDVAAGLARRGVDVTATDVHEFVVPDGVGFVRDDVTRPEADVYADADALYALNCPPELQRPVHELARRHDAAFYFTTLGGDPATVPAAPETIPGETLFVATTRPDVR